MERSLLLCNFKFFVEISKKSVLESVLESIRERFEKSIVNDPKETFLIFNLFLEYIPFGEISIFWFFKNIKKGNRQAKHVSLRLNSHVSTFDTLKGRGFYEIFNALANFYPFIDVSTRNFQFFNFFSYVWSL